MSSTIDTHQCARLAYIVSTHTHRIHQASYHVCPRIRTHARIRHAEAQVTHGSHPHRQQHGHLVSPMPQRGEVLINRQHARVVLDLPPYLPPYHPVSRTRMPSTMAHSAIAPHWGSRSLRLAQRDHIIHAILALSIVIASLPENFRLVPRVTYGWYTIDCDTPLDYCPTHEVRRHTHHHHQRPCQPWKGSHHLRHIRGQGTGMAHRANRGQGVSPRHQAHLVRLCRSSAQRCSPVERCVV